jgi:hypothetical protein
MSQLQVSRINDASGGVLAPISSVMRNRIINGAMVIDQRNAGASVTPNNNYTVDRFWVLNSASSKLTAQQNAGSVTPPAGFINYLGLTSTSSYSVTSSDYFSLVQSIEGLNVADLGWGTASAKTVTLSFWVRSSLTGTFGGSLQNSSQTRSYPFSYSIPAANTWTQISVTVTGDTTGTWLTNNGVGIYVFFGLGNGSTYSGTAGAWAGSNFFSATGATSVVGTSGATFYITGVQLEVGTQATSFEYRQYQQELALCQRYYETTSFPSATFTLAATRTGIVFVGNITFATGNNFAMTKRASPTVTLFSRNNTAGAVSLVATGGDVGGCTAGAINAAGFGNISLGASQTAGAGIEVGFTASAEL